MSRRFALVAVFFVFVATGCARISPPPSANFGEMALSAQQGQTTVAATAGAGGAFFGGGGHAGEASVSHQVSERLRVGVEGGLGIETDSSSLGGGGTLASGRLVLRYRAVETGSGELALVSGVGGGHYTEGELGYVTGDLGLAASGQIFDWATFYGGPIAAFSLPVTQSGLVDEDGEVIEYPEAGYVGANLGSAFHLTDNWQAQFEFHSWYEVAHAEKYTAIVGATVSTSVRF